MGRRTRPPSKQHSAATIELPPLADQEPWIITALRILHDRDRIRSARPDILERTYGHLQAILEAWEKNENLEQLRNGLGVGASPRRRPRTKAVVKRRCEIVNALMNAAVNDSCEDPWETVYQKLDATEIETQRAWKLYGATFLKIVEVYNGLEVAQQIETRLDPRKRSRQ